MSADIGSAPRVGDVITLCHAGRTHATRIASIRADAILLDDARFLGGEADGTNDAIFMVAQPFCREVDGAVE